MIPRHVKKLCRHFLYIQKRHCHNENVSKIRNLGILAHIDAGKTTTTERMLFYSGRTSNLGEVHHGNTVTDYLEQERERGITICSSAVTFPWKEHRFNLLDTPGHIDFTMEVEQSLSAVDGTIIILDGSAGVEAQTVTVWSQSERYKIPKMVFVNKMDRSDADFEGCVLDIKKRLGVVPLVIQWPVYKNQKFTSIIDLINMTNMEWDTKSRGREFQITPLPEELTDQANFRRHELLDTLSSFNNEIAEAIILNNSYDKIPNDIVYKGIRDATISLNVSPVLLGSAYKNIGIQSLMDAVVHFLPAPSERSRNYKFFEKDFVGKVFKVSHDKRKGALNLVRVFNGNLKKGMRISTLEGSAEVIQKVYEPLADEYKEVSSIGQGGVGVCTGLKNTVTGDLLLSSASSVASAQKKFVKSLSKKNDEDEVGIVENIIDVLGLKPNVPDAVYFCSIEPPSISYQNALDAALKQLQREDPSLRVKYDETTGQTVLGGMGELHLEIIKSRLLTEYKIDADLGPLQIAYKETINSECREMLSIEKEIAGSKQNISLDISLVNDNKEIFRLDKTQEAMENLNKIPPRLIQTIKKGALSGLERGPRIGGEVIDTQIILHGATIGRGTAQSFIMAAAAQAVQKVLRKSETRILEPIMSIQITVPSDRVSTVLGDLGKRRATINSVNPRGNENKIIDIIAPLSELSGYSSALRTITSGTASMTMQPAGYSRMSAQDEVIAVQRAQGFC